MKAWKLLAACVAVLGCVAGASAQEWPQKPVKIVVPYPAGAGVDPVARLVGQKLADRWKQNVIVDNKPGGSGTIGATSVARAPADGLTIMMSATAEVVINQFIMEKMQYDPETDLVPVTLAVRLPFILVTHPSSPYSSVAELVAFAKKNPGKVTYASSGPGTPQHLAAVLLEQLGGVQLVHVPYKGVAPSITDLLANHVSIGFAGLPAGLPHVQKGALKPLAVSSKVSSPAAPQVPPVAATPGLEQFELNQWFGIWVPKGTPEPIVAQIQRDIAAVLQMPEVKDTLEKQGAQPSGMPTAEFAKFVRGERKKFEAIVKHAKLD
ncbi:tripartite tricarboxylate transporter substrate binding protein [Ramlibacter tataouinensis]|uniref:Bug family tripartite tricarboxylate transporter substrate binding protein n=1 Tax=Ramlibacter tataouinensis TaxID=94132 RepID=UPI0022F3FE29|nr:tripartite tricarboxylate transporter substrate binding protein [Ramlibacter tataouinensis]WBY03136.1 tripartite tricarboxylate transporter substrate binding protein [Ramlibacter tataouinensis]